MRRLLAEKIGKLPRVVSAPARPRDVTAFARSLRDEEFGLALYWAERPPAPLDGKPYVTAYEYTAGRYGNERVYNYMAKRIALLSKRSSITALPSNPTLHRIGVGASPAERLTHALSVVARHIYGKTKPELWARYAHPEPFRLASAITDLYGLIASYRLADGGTRETIICLSHELDVSGAELLVAAQAVSR
jgi:hypothetical protein